MLDRIIVAGTMIPADRIGEAEAYARFAAKSGQRADIVRLSGVLLCASAYAHDDALELQYSTECVALLDGLASEGCEDSARLLSEIAETVSPKAMALADAINRKLAKDEQ